MIRDAVKAKLFPRGESMTEYERIGEYRVAERSGFGVALTFLLIGLGAGALAALLFAPKSGRQVRRMLRRTYDAAVGGLNQEADNLSEWANTAKEKVTPIARRLKNL